MLLRASGGGQLLILRGLRFIEDNGLITTGVTSRHIVALSNVGITTVSTLLRAANVARRAVRWRVGTDRLEYAYELTDMGREWIDLQERYGAPPDQFRDPSAFAAWKARHPNMPWVVRVDLKVHPVRALPWSPSGVGGAVPEFAAPWERY